MKRGSVANVLKGLNGYLILNFLIINDQLFQRIHVMKKTRFPASLHLHIISIYRELRLHIENIK